MHNLSTLQRKIPPPVNSVGNKPDTRDEPLGWPIIVTPLI